MRESVIRLGAFGAIVVLAVATRAIAWPGGGTPGGGHIANMTCTPIEPCGDSVNPMRCEAKDEGNDCHGCDGTGRVDTCMNGGPGCNTSPNGVVCGNAFAGTCQLCDDDTLARAGNEFLGSCSLIGCTGAGG